MKALTLAAVGLAGWPLAEAEGKPDMGGLQWQGKLVSKVAHQTGQGPQEVVTSRSTATVTDTCR